MFTKCLGSTPPTLPSLPDLRPAYGWVSTSVTHLGVEGILGSRELDDQYPWLSLLTDPLQEVMCFRRLGQRTAYPTFLYKTKDHTPTFLLP